MGLAEFEQATGAQAASGIGGQRSATFRALRFGFHHKLRLKSGCLAPATRNNLAKVTKFPAGAHTSTAETPCGQTSLLFGV